ncbi:carotenoid isomerooxygenase-like [Vanessa atalanta]|uniref:carotenoid isomerooxygenase-like n=1 Tax=Vanessa atalanta TaxID=42275 RepID=UPI001FCDFF6A|nr:carotenoid isomerooxygenase-like [Vanessa atalanta]
MTETKKLYPNYDMNIWFRTCEEEINEPLEGETTGVIPSWVRGTLLRNGPGCNKIGSYQYDHVFDGLALIHRFSIKHSKVTYQCRFVRSETYKKNTTANRIVVTEFGTKAVPDPCRSIFDRISSIFNFTMDQTDNTAVSVYPFGDQVYAMTEVPVLYKIDPVTLETVGKEKLADSLVVCHTAHPHVMPNGDVYNVGLNTVKGDLRHVVVKFPYSDKGDMFEAVEIVGSSKPRWRFNPAYMHSFGVTENYFVIIEQPLVISLLNLMRRRFIVTEPFASTLVSYPECETNIILIHRVTGEEKRYPTDTIYFMHVINCFETDGALCVDLCSYKDANILNAMYVSAIKDMHSNPDYGQWCQCRPKRIEIPLEAPPLTKVESRLIADVGVETPMINYKLCNGKPYRYFYGIGSDVDTGDAGSIVKVDTKTGEVLYWKEPQCYPSEPIFIANPDGQGEDDGVLLSAVLWSQDDRAIALLVLNAKNLEEIARAHFTTPSQTAKCFHGWFLPDQMN